MHRVSAARVLTTPWTRAALAEIGWDDRTRADLAARLPDGANLHIAGKGPRGPWIVRLFIDGREVSPTDEYGRVPSYRDLGHAIDYVLAHGGVRVDD